MEPDVVLMTNIGDSHIEHFGSREKILEAKSEIFHHVKSGAFVVINGDDPLLNTCRGSSPMRSPAWAPERGWTIGRRGWSATQEPYDL